MSGNLVLPRVVIDTREQRSWQFPEGVRTVRRKLDAGDYSLEGYTDSIGIERKSLDDLVQSLSRGRERFMRALGRLRDRRFHCVIVEGDFGALTAGYYRGNVNPSALVGSVAAMIADGTGVVFASSDIDAAVLGLRLLTKYHSRAVRMASEVDAA